ncbi:MAG: type II toxin-antitoxin system RelE/ParE family toxin [Pseudomonadota bacterium]|jgi:plasmid stabilization system protein ParE
MALQIRIAARAAKRVREASEWWSVNRPSAPNAIAADFGEAVSLLAEQPGIGAKYEGSRTVGVRRLFLSRVGYFIYYKAENGFLHVLAFWHASREHQPSL